METSPDRTRRSGGHARSGPLLRTRDADAAPPQHRAPSSPAREGTRSREGTRARPGGLQRPVPVLAGAAGVVALLIGGAAVLMGGDDAPPATSAAAPRSSASAAPASPSAAAAPAADGELSPAVVAALAADRTATDARAALEEQLSARADANLELLRGTWQGDAAAASRAADVVATSSAGLSAVVTTWRDAALASQLRTGLDQQSEASRAYAAAVASGDVAAADRARAQMGEISRGLGDVLDRVTDGRIAAYVPPQDAAQYRAFVDALEAEDAAAADEAAGWLRARLGREGVALAEGLS